MFWPGHCTDGFQKKKKLDRGVGGWVELHPIFFWIFGIFLTLQSPLDQLYKPAMVIHTIITTIHHHHPHNQRKHGRLVLTLHLVFINSPDKADSVLDKLLGRSLTGEREAVIRNELQHPP